MSLHLLKLFSFPVYDSIYLVCFVLCRVDKLLIKRLGYILSVRFVFVIELYCPVWLWGTGFTREVFYCFPVGIGIGFVIPFSI